MKKKKHLLNFKVPVLLIQKGTGISKVLGSGSLQKSWVLLDYTVLTSNPNF